MARILQNLLKIFMFFLFMLYIKEGFPQINEFVYCTVTQIYANTVFLKLEEYEKEGTLTISEISPGRIRNLREYVEVGRKTVCKVLRIDENLKRIDVSLRRVSLHARNSKLEQIKKEEFADKVYNEVSKKINISKDELFEKTYEKIFENYETVFESLYDIMFDNKKISMFEKLDKSQRERFLKAINEKIKPENFSIRKKFKLTSFEKNGVIVIKEAISEAKKELDSKIPISKIIYVSGGEFEISLESGNLKDLDLNISKFFLDIEKQLKQKKLFFEKIN